MPDCAEVNTPNAQIVTAVAICARIYKTRAFVARAAAPEPRRAVAGAAAEARAGRLGRAITFVITAHDTPLATESSGAKSKMLTATERTRRQITGR
ncbi:hypothetical protein EVAR_97591_1 [Eumeta japonica]|uniref:Uncharacterized protein n=1 Tax=Eumeta variegata TaxID=151549 RepID=A0A4C1XM33_EUMVA|nr:hypothetical protein EVAR_97591_1 [Eumeta japonica]